jgi:plastocyanin
MKNAMRLMQCAVLLGGGLWLPMCGSSNSNGGIPGTSGSGGAPAAAAIITIQNNAFSPLNLTVAAGATVLVTNMDTVQHSVTSETAKDSFQPGGVNGVSFDTQSFGTGAKTFTITASATSGTVVPYYCRVHTSSMTQGTITIQ